MSEIAKVESTWGGRRVGAGKKKDPNSRRSVADQWGVTPYHMKLAELTKELGDPVIEQAIETAARMLGSDRSRGYCLKMICADFLAGANLDNGDPETLLFSATRFFRFLPEDQKQAFLNNFSGKGS